MLDDHYIQDYLDILEIDQDCDEHILKSSYRRLIKVYHPDKHYNDNDKLKSVTEKAVMINDAYNYLKRYIEEHGTIFINKKSNDYIENLDIEYNYADFTPGFPESGVFEYFVHSSNVLSCGYSVDTKILYLKFRRNYAVYKYYDVDQSVFFNLMEAESHGKYVNKYIAYSYQYEWCKEENIPYTGPKDILNSK